MRREGKETDVEAGERDAGICALESELTDRREESDILEDARGQRAELQMEMGRGRANARGGARVVSGRC